MNACNKSCDRIACNKSCFIEEIGDYRYDITKHYFVDGTCGGGGGGMTIWVSSTMFDFKGECDVVEEWE